MESTKDGLATTSTKEKTVIEHEKKLAQFAYDLLTDDEDMIDGDMTLEEFQIEWEKYGMLVAIYNLGYMRAKIR